MASQTKAATAAKSRHTRTEAAADTAVELSTDTTAAQEAKLTELAAAVQGKGLYAKIAWVQHHVGHVDKTGQMSHGNVRYPFMQEHGLLNVLRPLWRIVGLSVIPGQLSPEDFARDGNLSIVKIGLTVTDTASGDSITRYFVNEGVDNADKGFGKAYTGAVKYALQKFFLVPTEAIDDNDTVSPERVGGTSVAAEVRNITSAKPSPDDLAELRKTLGENVEQLGGASKIKNKLTADYGISSIDDFTSKKDFMAFAKWVVDQLDTPEDGEKS